jgi:hypothetical protein
MRGVIDSTQTKVYATGRNMPPATIYLDLQWRPPLIERRRATRFHLNWQIRVLPEHGNEGNAVASGVLQNLSSSGALLSLPEPLATGTQLKVYIRLPLNERRWMRYSASVLRIEPGSAAITAVKFDGTRPDFGQPLILI